MEEKMPDGSVRKLRHSQLNRVNDCPSFDRVPTSIAKKNLAVKL